MIKIAISAETTIDLTEEILERFDIKTVPYSVCLGDEVRWDGELSNEELVEYVNKTKTLPKTCAVNREQFREHFEKLLKDYDAVIHFALSSELSSAYNNAVAEAETLKNVFVLDSRSLSSGIGLLAIYGRKLADTGYSPKEIYEKCLKRVPYVQVSSALKRVDYLYLGGRCGMLSLLGANILRIRPQIIIREGKIYSGKKYRGKFEHVVKQYVRDTLNEFCDPDLSIAVVAYTTAPKDIVKYAENALKERGFKEVFVVRAGATVTSHCGEECLGVYYINDGGKS